MDFIINEEELSALCGIPHSQQLAYLRGIRPYMDVTTGIVGIKRKISHQSIAEQLFIEPHQGIKSQSFSRAQVRRALTSLERSGLIHIQSEDYQLILKCKLATLGYFVQNKPVTNPSYQPVITEEQTSLEKKGFYAGNGIKADTFDTAKAVTPLNSNNYYIFLLQQFEIFWTLYPVKKSQQQAWQVYQSLNPSESLITQIQEALQAQIDFYQQQQARGQWVPNWKNPANWLTQRCWEDEITMETTQEYHHATNRKNTGNEECKDLFWNPELFDDSDESPTDNVIPFRQQQG